ncbi:MAG TPA: DinB family protein [Pyrinomonadaceae bacterium]|nr:DinB family protein [Pyrinomonadaceae bacterium]
MDRTNLLDLYRHMEWADALVWRAVFATDGAVNDEKINKYFYHLHLVQRAFIRAWRHEPTDAPFPTFDDLRSVHDWGRSYYGEIFSFLEQQSEAAISAQMKLPWAELVTKQLGRSPAPITIGETMLQVPLHSLYHRGQINARLREVGGEPPTVDYIVWVWLDRPAAVWDE